MSLILNIDTALNQGSVCLSRGGSSLQLMIQENQKSQAGWLHIAIASMLQQQGFKAADLDAVAVNIGPGSYTGLRVGLSAAKGICYALQLPLITVNSLEIMAYAVKEEAVNIICPMIDARRMEVFTALYDSSIREKFSPCALIIDQESIKLFPDEPIVFCGSGSKKIQPLIKNKSAIFSDTQSNAAHLAVLSTAKFINKEFADLAYTEPFYVKEFYTQ